MAFAPIILIGVVVVGLAVAGGLAAWFILGRDKEE